SDLTKSMWYIERALLHSSHPGSLSQTSLHIEIPASPRQERRTPACGPNLPPLFADGESRWGGALGTEQYQVLTSNDFMSVTAVERSTLADHDFTVPCRTTIQSDEGV